MLKGAVVAIDNRNRADHHARHPGPGRRHGATRRAVHRDEHVLAGPAQMLVTRASAKLVMAAGMTLTAPAADGFGSHDGHARAYGDPVGASGPRRHRGRTLVGLPTQDGRLFALDTGTMSPISALRMDGR